MSGPLAPPWGLHPVPAGESCRVELGALTLWLRALPSEVRLAHVPGDWTRAGRRAEREEGAPAGSEGGKRPDREAGSRPPVDSRRPETQPDDPPAEMDWIRWPVSEKVERVHLSPAFPPRPVVVEPESSFRLLPRARARIFVRLPLWVTVRLGGSGGRQLAELPGVILSDTWWGDPTEGELCHWMPTSARREVEPRLFAPHLAVASLELRNASDEELPVERFVVRGEHLTLFAEDDRLWSDQVTVRYRGVEVGSDVSMSGKAPPEAGEAVRVAEPRSPRVKGFRARSFARLKGLPGLAGL